ncbi:MAG: amidohydrolase family protein [Chloroflexi bacterium]|nr:amidohydrolase family protein [Chloroflexota bacterium]
MGLDTVIRNGTLITPDGPINADLGIEGETIAAISQGLMGRQVVDATGKLVIPGAIDPHVHLEMPAGAVQSSDDWITGTIAAACGGTTTVIDFVEPIPPALLPAREGEDLSGFENLTGLRRGGVGPLLSALAARRGLAEGRAAIDFGLHMTLLNAQSETLDEIPAVVAAGCPSFKTYTTYSFKLTDDVLVAAMAAVGKAGGIVMVHAENDAGIAYLRRKLLAEGKTEPRWHPRSRPAGMEVEAIERALALAEAAECPAYIVHISTGRGAAAVAGARHRGQAAFGETCPQYLLLTDAEFDRPGFEGAKFICSPPLRKAEDNAALWRYLAATDLQTVGTDHCPFFYAGQKDLRVRRGEETLRASVGGETPPLPAFTQIPGGMPGIESRLSLLYTFGVRAGRLTLARWVEACCTGPARIFGLVGRKGVLAVGADADVVIFDPEREAVLTHAGATHLGGAPHVHRLHENCDYTPYEGLRLRGWPALTMLRGQVIARDGEFVGQQGAGKFLARGNK